MQDIAEAYINDPSYPASRKLPRPTKEGWTAILLGIVSAGLYFLLYRYSGDIRHWAEMTNHGDKVFFLAPIGIAFIFSTVHGLFTDRFWSAVGLKAKC